MFAETLSKFSPKDYTPQTWHCMLSLEAFNLQNANALQDMDEIIKVC